MSVAYLNSSVGTLRIVTSTEGVAEVLFVKNDDGVGLERGNPEADRVAELCLVQLREYFEGSRKTFDLPLSPSGTVFQKEVWGRLKEIPYGKTVTYLDIANMMGDSKKIRAVGRANGANPVAIIIPCHRVIGSGGQMTGYAGGIDKKLWLLKHEGGILI